MSAAKRNKAVVRGIYETAVTRDLDAYLALIHPDIEVEQPGWLPYGGTHRGVDALLAMLREVGKQVDVSGLELESLVAEDDHVWACFVVPTRGDGAGVSIAEHWRIEDGRAKRLKVWFFDPTPVMEQLGGP